MTHAEDHVGDHALDFVRIDIDTMYLQSRLERRDGYAGGLVACDPAFKVSARSYSRSKSAFPDCTYAFLNNMRRHPSLARSTTR